MTGWGTFLSGPYTALATGALTLTVHIIWPINSEHFCEFNQHTVMLYLESVLKTHLNSLTCTSWGLLESWSRSRDAASALKLLKTSVWHKQIKIFPPQTVQQLSIISLYAVAFRCVFKTWYYSEKKKKKKKYRSCFWCVTFLKDTQINVCT